ncbi:hypothetical protein FRACYDRAFT_256510 [Fragilariopsis cylindrus CCMP1102]|uniref:Uncharacterized protein n=1 Tax=Fragilariopsis cylindrus CCMP1102 TaxID=635003 RepID=A0A1E7EJL5_9STRA|nr:hypothetical protein FRACYDRAFT_256510 [Fragilariopsis cylindrus CCMP1102]|eukprot:OEU06084.1 hypothetical protein FRACYDRAFT_256510 [Fragilariopsis cylindrus CCMP1102]
MIREEEEKVKKKIVDKNIFGSIRRDKNVDHTSSRQRIIRTRYRLELLEPYDDDDGGETMVPKNGAIMDGADTNTVLYNKININNNDSIAGASSRLEIQHNKLQQKQAAMSKNNTTKGTTTTSSTVKAIIGETVDPKDKIMNDQIKDEHRKINIVPRVWRLDDTDDAAVNAAVDDDINDVKNNNPPPDDAVVSFPCADYGPFLRIISEKKQENQIRNTIFPLQAPLIDISKPPGYSLPPTVGLLFIKPMKVGSSTASGIQLRISKNIAERRRDYIQQQHQHQLHNSYNNITTSTNVIVTNSTDYPPKYNNVTSSNSSTTLLCSNHFWHSHSALMFENRDRKQSFLWTLLREPTQRMMSEFYHFFVTRQHIEPTDDNLLALLSNSSIRHRNYYINLHTHRYGIGVVTLGDMLYLNAKVSGGYDDGGYKSTCYKILKPPPIKDWSRRLKNYLYKNNNHTTINSRSRNNSNKLQLKQVDPWMDQIEHDLALWEAANISLDRTIDALGRAHVFEPRLQQYRDAQAVVQKRCGNEAHFPCDHTTREKRKSKDTNCLFGDSGCAYQCLDQTAQDLGI